MQIELATRTLLVEFQETVRSRAVLEKEIFDGKRYVRKTVKGKVYWYEQRYEDRQARQTYFGPSNSKNDKFVNETRKTRRSDQAVLKKLRTIEARQAAMLRSSGLPMLDRRMAVLLSHFSEAGLIHRNGVLVGTLAYTAYASMLGYAFEKTTLMTQDIDIARDDKIQIAAPTIDVETLLSGRGIQCRPIPTLSKKVLPSTFVSSDGIRIDFLVPLRGRAKQKVYMPRIAGAGATALRFLDYLIEKPVESALLAPSGGILTTVPRPERFAVHKLIVAAYRPVTESAKKEKDLYQASQLITVLAEDRPRQLKTAFRTAVRGGTKWV